MLNESALNFELLRQTDEEIDLDPMHRPAS